MGKILETLIKTRLEDELKEKNIINDHQYGFRSGRSTINALQNITEIHKKIKEKAYQHQEFSILIAIDIKNAFNSAPWNGIITALREANISNYLIKIVQSYLTNRYILTNSGQKVQTTCGVPQGSVIGPTMWNIFYNRILNTQMPSGVTLIAYADDLAIVAQAKTKTMLEAVASLAVEKVANTLIEMELEMAPQKTEMLIIAGRRKLNNISIPIENTIIINQSVLKYMGVYLDKDLRMTAHIKKNI